jgi:L-ascorbate metabolism protein UlaG (beta-lactamase superfamily)
MRTTGFLICVGIIVVAGAVWGGELPAQANVIATDAGPLVIRPVRHATFVMQWNDKVIAVDPVGGDEAFAGLPKADLILVTDIHGDHLSAETIAVAGGDGAEILAPAAVAEILPAAERERVTVLGNGESTAWQGITIEAVPMYNLDPERQAFHPKGRGNGYLLTFGTTRVYIAGDTEDIPEMRALENIDAAFMCMNLPYTMDVAAAADAVLEFQPRIVFPYHYRGKDGMSDLDEFTALVAKDPTIEVRVLAWY